MSEKHHWDKKHKAQFINTPNSVAKVEFEKVLEKANKMAGNKEKYTPNVQTSYMTRDGVPHKFKDGQWVPLTRIN